jgi:hypothetical protein
MDDMRRDGVSRSEFLRRTGALGIAGATSLGLTLPETRAAGAAPLGPRDTIAAGAARRSKSVTSTRSRASTRRHPSRSRPACRLAVDEANRKNSRVQFAIVRGDDTNQPAVGSNEAKRLISQEKVDVLAGCLSSASDLPSRRSPRRTASSSSRSERTTRTSPVPKPTGSASERRARTRCSRTPSARRSSRRASAGISSPPTTRSATMRTTGFRRSFTRRAAQEVGSTTNIRSGRPTTRRT